MALRLAAFASLILSVYSQDSQHVLSPHARDSGILRRFSLNDHSEVKRLFDLASSHDLDIWHSSKEFVDIYFPDSTEPLLPFLANVNYSTSFPSAILPQRLIEDSWNLTSLENTTFHDEYHPLSEIDKFLRDLVELYPSKANLVHLGHSGEGRPMLALKISTGPLNQSARVRPDRERWIDPHEKLGFVITGAQHAREWIATATSLHIAHALLSTNETFAISQMLEHYDFYIVPVPNPDGYKYTWETDRFWYKNRQVVTPRGTCVGLDMNRNWGYKWKSDANGPALHDADNMGKKKKKKKHPTFPNPCSHWFPGHRAFEASEVNNIANFVGALPNLVAFWDLRSYGQMISAPYSYSCKRSAKDAEDQIEAAMGASFALTSLHGTHFSTGTVCEQLYRAPGNIVDWMYNRAGIKYSYVVHLRDTGTYGFSLPSKFIRPASEETGKAIEYLAKFITKQLKRST